MKVHSTLSQRWVEGKRKKANPHARKVSICQLSEGILFEIPNSQGKLFNIFCIQRPGNQLTAEVQRAVLG